MEQRILCRKYSKFLDVNNWQVLIILSMFGGCVNDLVNVTSTILKKDSLPAGAIIS